MIQNILALAIVFLTTAYTLYSIVKSLTVKTSSSCGGCTGCALKEHPGIKHGNHVQHINFQSQKLSLLKSDRN